jgi:hypothetical protein
MYCNTNGDRRMIILPNNEVRMSKEIFDQDPALFMKMMVGSLTIMRTNNEEADRLERIFNRDFIKEIFAKKSWTFEDYELVLECCI